MAQIKAPESQAQQRVGLVRVSPSISLLQLGFQRWIAFFRGKPVAVQSGAVVYWHCDPGPERRAVNALLTEGLASALTDAPNFDFIVGQLLTQTGLPLCRLPKQSEAQPE